MEIGKFSEHIVENEKEVKDVVATNEDKKLEAEEVLDQHFDILMEMETFSEHIVENEEEVKDVVAINDDKNMKQKKILIIIVISQ